MVSQTVLGQLWVWFFLMGSYPVLTGNSFACNESYQPKNFSGLEVQVGKVKSLEATYRPVFGFFTFGKNRLWACECKSSMVAI